MRAHALRRTFWIVDLLAAAGVVAVAAWFFLDVSKATAAPEYVKPKFAAKATDDYKRRGHPGRIESAVVSNKQVEEIDRPEYRALNYWIFSGPGVPEPKAPEAVVADKGPQGLAELGKVTYLFFFPPKSSITFQFTSGKKRAFAPGEFVKADKADPDRFKLVDVVRDVPDSSVFKLKYEVYDKDGKVTGTGDMIYDATRKGTGPFREVPAVAVTPGTPGGDAAAATDKPGGDPTAKVIPGTAGPAPASAEPAGPPPPFAELRPEMSGSAASGAVRIDFDQNTYDFVRGKNVNELAETVKTMEAKDAKGNSLGLRITGFSGDSPAQKFDIKEGDILVSIDGQAVHSRSDVVNLIQRMNPNTNRVVIVIDRRGKQITYTIDPRDPKTRRAAGQAVDRLGTR